MVKIPKAYIDAWAAEVTAVGEARAANIKATGKLMAKGATVDEQIIAIAAETNALKIARQQRNALGVLAVAVDDLRSEPNLGPAPAQEVSDDWLNAFEREAVDMSSVEMQLLFGKILAGEIRKPGSFSRRTIKVISQLDNFAATAFRRACSLATAIEFNGEVVDARIITVGAEAPGNIGLQAYGLQFSTLSVLIEYGLIIPELETEMTYGSAMVLANGFLGGALRYQGRREALLPAREFLPEVNRTGILRGTLV